MQEPPSRFAEEAARDAGIAILPGDETRWRILEHLRFLGDAIDALQDDYASAVGLGRTELDAVAHLSEAPMVMGALGRRLSLSPAAVTGLVDRLERVGHVRRLPGERDRRQTIVELTPPARQMVGEFFGALARRLMTELEPYTDKELAAIERFLAVLPTTLNPPRPAIGDHAPTQRPVKKAQEAIR